MSTLPTASPHAIYTVQDSLRDEDKARKLEEDHRQSQLRLRLQKVLNKFQENSKKILRNSKKS
eukprot:816472-Amorphochlora_amoeboformis.AAC.1